MACAPQPQSQPRRVELITPKWGRREEITVSCPKQPISALPRDAQHECSAHIQPSRRGAPSGDGQPKSLSPHENTGVFSFSINGALGFCLPFSWPPGGTLFMPSSFSGMLLSHQRHRLSRRCPPQQPNLLARRSRNISRQPSQYPILPISPILTAPRHR